MEDWLQPALRFLQYAFLLGLFGWAGFRVVGLRAAGWLPAESGRTAAIGAAGLGPIVSVGLMLASIAAMMELSNFLGKAKRSTLYATAAWNDALHKFNLMLAPYAPHISEEIWHRMGHTDSVHLQPYPNVDESKLVKDSFELVVQVSGKLRGRVDAPTQISSEHAIALAKSLEIVQGYIAGKEIVKEIYVPGKLVNIVVKG
mgnify:CR=1 FL=1